MIIRSYQDKQPRIHPSAWIAENAVIIGEVEIGPDTNIWYNVVIRGDLNHVRIGSQCNIQDAAVIHVESEDGPCIIGDRVTIGHQAIVHACKVGDDALIGMGATVLSWASIGSGALVAAGALVKEYAELPTRTLWAGVPAKERGSIGDELFERMQAGCRHYLELAEVYRREDAAVQDH